MIIFYKIEKKNPPGFFNRLALAVKHLLLFNQNEAIRTARTSLSISRLQHSEGLDR